MNIRVFGNLVVMALAISLCPPVLADEFSVTTGKRPFTIGIGALYKDKPYRGFDDDEKTDPVPVILYEGERFFVRGATLGWKFSDADPMEFAVIGEYIADGYEASDSNFLTGMEERDPTFGVGAHVLWKPDNIGIKLAAVTDASDNSEGSVVRGELFYSHQSGPWHFQPRAALVWQSDDYVDYYYGVEASEAVAGRPSYSGDSELSYRVGALLTYQQPTSPWMFLLGARFDFLGDEIDNSPITEEDSQLNVLAGIAYTFGK